MPNAGARRCLTRTALTACLAYVLAVQLILASMVGGAQAARSLDAFDLSSRALCLTGTAGDAFERHGSVPASPHRHDLCCTLACGVALPASGATVIAVVYGPMPPVRVETIFSARSETPPGLGRGPRAPPRRLV